MSKLFDFNNDVPLGIQYGDYDSRLISSSQEFKNYYASNGKLNSPTAWCPAISDKNNHPWIQVSLSEEKFITSVTLQGRKDKAYGNQFVTKFRILYSKDGKNFQHLEEFEGLSDVDQTIKRWFTIPIKCIAIRLQVLEYNCYPSLRFELGYAPDYLIETKVKEKHNNNFLNELN